MAYLLGWEVDRVQAMPLPEFQAWAAYFAEYPPVDQIVQDYLARLMCLLAPGQGVKGLQIGDFYCEYGYREPVSIEAKIQAAFGSVADGQQTQSRN